MFKHVSLCLSFFIELIKNRRKFFFIKIKPGLDRRHVDAPNGRFSRCARKIKWSPSGMRDFSQSICGRSLAGGELRQTKVEKNKQRQKTFSAREFMTLKCESANRREHFYRHLYLGSFSPQPLNAHHPLGFVNQCLFNAHATSSLDCD